MCGDLEEESPLETALCQRFRLHARTLLKAHARGAGPAATAGTSSYMDALFSDALSRLLRDLDGVDEERRYELLAAQPVVFARLAGFLAAHAAPQEDPLRKVIEALMHGYAEAEEIEPDHGHDHDPDHDDEGHERHAHHGHVHGRRHGQQH